MSTLSLISLIFLLLGMKILRPDVEGSQTTNPLKTSIHRPNKVLIQNHHYHCHGSGRVNDVMKSLTALGKKMKVQFDQLNKEMKFSTQKQDQQHANVVARIVRLEKKVNTLKTSQGKLKQEMKEELGQLNEYVNVSRIEMKLAKWENDRQLAMIANGVETVKKSQTEVKKEIKGEFDQLNKDVVAYRIEMMKTTRQHDRNLTYAIGKLEKGNKNFTSSQSELKKDMKGLLEQVKKELADYGVEMKNATSKCRKPKNKNITEQVVYLKKDIQKMNAELRACNAPSLGAAAGGRLSNSRFTASSVYDNRYFAKYGRLNYHKTRELAWAPKSVDNIPPDYLQVDLGAQRVICAVATQGCPGPHQLGSPPEWTTTYKISLSSDGSTWDLYQDNGSDKVFTGNTDAVSIVKNALPRPIQARYIRFIPITYHQYKALRVDVYGHSY